MKFITITYRTSKNELNRTYSIKDNAEIKALINDDIESFREDYHININTYSIREATKNEVISYLEEYENDDLIYMICNLLNL